MTVVDQSNLFNLISQYNKIDSTTIKRNIIRLIDDSQYHKNIPVLARRLDVNVNTVYGWRQPQRKLNVGFEAALKLSHALGVSITELMK